MLFPKPERRKKQKRNRELDPDYLKFIAGWPCCVPNCGAWPVEVHHVDKKSHLGSDRSAVPLCAMDHRGRLHSQGEKTWTERWGINWEDQIKKYNDLYENGAKGPHDHEVRDKSYRAT